MSLWSSLPESGVELSNDRLVNHRGGKRPLGIDQSKRLIKSGALRKATSKSVGRFETTRWKTKNVELTPGRLAYADEGPSVLGKRWEGLVGSPDNPTCVVKGVPVRSNQPFL